MIPLHLYIEDFLCHDKSHIDFTQFKSALVVGKIDGNEAYSNGVGKTTIFKAIEYVLFNMSDVNLEKLIRDDANSCKITFIFKSDSDIYRVCRTRTKKGTSDLSLFKKKEFEGDDSPCYSESVSELYWKDISGRRTPDTDKDLAKLIKINSKSFRNTVHFAQNDFTGLTTATPEKRKLLLKEALSLSIYSKLEKMSKEKLNSLNKEIDKCNNTLQLLGDPEEEINLLSKNLQEAEDKLSLLNKEITTSNEDLNSFQEKNKTISSQLEKILNENKILISQKEKILLGKEAVEKSLKDFNDKKGKVLQEAKKMSLSLKEIKDQKDNLESSQLPDINELSKKIEALRNEVASINAQKKNILVNIQDLEIPLPQGSACKHCRQTLSSEHIENCKQEVKKEIQDKKNSITNLNNDLELKTKNLNKITEEARDAVAKHNLIKDINIKYSSLQSELASKKEIYNDYVNIIKGFETDLSNKNNELLQIESSLDKTSLDKTEELNNQLLNLNNKISNLQTVINQKNKEIGTINNSIAVTNHSINQKKKDLEKKKEINQEIKKLNQEHEIYPKVIESFSSYGIPNLIIQNLLDDLQEEANKLLNNLKPGLQLQFVVQKEKKDGSSDDTLDILYFIQGKSREFEQLSGAMKLAVNFSLKIGLSFLLQKTFDTNINFLLLDEIDQSLDKAGVDAFADIVKYFQKDFTILVITHNSLLKDKFNHAVLVEQNKNMVSTASVVTSW